MYVRSTKLEKTSLSFTNGLALNSSVALRLILIKLLSANGDGEIRTLDPLLARQVLSQLSYTPIWILFNSIGLAFKLMGLSGLEPPTSRLSGVRSNRLSYKPISIWQPPAFPYRHQYSIIGRFRLNHRVRDVDGCFPKAHRHQKTASRALALHALEVSSKLPFVINFH